MNKFYNLGAMKSTSLSFEGSLKYLSPLFTFVPASAVVVSSTLTEILVRSHHQIGRTLVFETIYYFKLGAIHSDIKFKFICVVFHHFCLLWPNFHSVGLGGFGEMNK